MELENNNTGTQLVTQIEHNGYWRKLDGSQGGLSISSNIYWYCRSCGMLKTNDVCKSVKWIFDDNHIRTGKKLFCPKCKLLLYEEKIKYLKRGQNE